MTALLEAKNLVKEFPVRSFLGEKKRLAAVARETGIPVGFGLLTTETVEQALDRAGGKVGNKGAEAAASAVEMVQLLRRMAQGG